MSQGVAHDHRVYVKTPHLPLQGMAEIMPAPDFNADGCRCRMQLALAGIPQVYWLARSPMQYPLRPGSQCSQTLQQVGVNNGIQGITLFLFEWYHSPLVDDTPHMQHVLGIEIIWLQANRCLASQAHRRQQQH